jgi:hypothetical protein
MKTEVYTRIRNDKELRRKIADALNVESDTIYRQAVRGEKSEQLKKPLVVEFIAKQLGKTVAEIT